MSSVHTTHPIAYVKAKHQLAYSGWMDLLIRHHYFNQKKGLFPPSLSSMFPQSFDTFLSWPPITPIPFSFQTKSFPLENLSPLPCKFCMKMINQIKQIIQAYHTGPPQSEIL